MVPNLDIPRTTEARMASEFLANFFVGETKKNTHGFISEQDKNSRLITNYKAVYTGDLGRAEEAFIF